MAMSSARAETGAVTVLATSTAMLISAVLPVLMTVLLVWARRRADTGQLSSGAAGPVAEGGEELVAGGFGEGFGG